MQFVTSDTLRSRSVAVFNSHIRLFQRSNANGTFALGHARLVTFIVWYNS
jgi:hypothetical protein